MDAAKRGGFRTKLKSADAVEDEIGRYQALLDQTAEHIMSGVGVARGDVDRASTYKALGKFARTGDKDGFYNATLTEDPASGGVLVPFELANDIVVAQKKLDPFRTVARVVSIKTAASKYEQPVFDGEPDSGWVGEADPRSAGSMGRPVLRSLPGRRGLREHPGERLARFRNSDRRIRGPGDRQGLRSQGRSRLLIGTGTKQPVGFLLYPSPLTLMKIVPSARSRRL